MFDAFNINIKPILSDNKKRLIRIEEMKKEGELLQRQELEKYKE
jgi:hypothetical protein